MRPEGATTPGKKLGPISTTGGPHACSLPTRAMPPLVDISFGHTQQAVGAAIIATAPLRCDTASDRGTGHNPTERRQAVLREPAAAKDAERGASINLAAPKGQSWAPNSEAHL